MSRIGDLIVGIVSILIVVSVVLFLGYRSLRRSDDPWKLIFKWVLTLVIVVFGIFTIRGLAPPAWPPVAAAFAILVAIIWAPSIGEMISKLFTGFYTGGDEEPIPKPFYSIAQAKRARSQFDEAISDIRVQLEKFPGDFTGLMLIATIQAEDLKNLEAAKLTIEELANVPELPASGYASAFNALADWYLQVAKDPEPARAAFQRIIDEYPDTPYSNLALQRLASLNSAETTQAAKRRGPIHLPEGQKHIGLQQAAITFTDDPTPAAVAAGYLNQLQQHPLDSETREKLAVLYAEGFQRVDLAVDQLEQLIAQPNQSPKRIAHWLDVMATLHIQFGNDVASAEKAIDRIIEKFPGTAVAEMASARRLVLSSELKANEKSQVKRLGSYERNIGLK